MKKILIFILILTLLSGCAKEVSLPAPDLEADLNFWVSPMGKKMSADRPLNAIQWHWDDKTGEYHLFLPSEGSLSALQVWYAGTGDCALNGTPLQNGQKISLKQTGTYKLTLAGVDYTLNIMKSAKIGSLYLTTESGSMDYIHTEKGNKEKGTLRYVNAEGKVVYQGEMKELKGRGNATWDKEKKPYQLKTAEPAELVTGAGAHGTWLLLANYCEKTFIRNKLAYDLAADAGLPYTTRSEFLDLYCNGEYMGNYQLCEKVQIAENRIEITDLEKATEAVNDLPLKEYPAFGPAGGYKEGNRKGVQIPQDPADITGGYLLEIDYADRYKPEASGFVTNRKKPVVIKEPEYASEAQVQYIADYFQEFEDAVYAPDGINPLTGKHFSEYFDLTSLAQKYVLEEFVKNIDADRTSQFYYKPAGSVGYCGPVWDYDNAFDNFNSGARSDGMFAAEHQNYLYAHLSDHAVFMDEVKKQWNEVYRPLIDVMTGEKAPPKGTLLRSIDYYYDLLSPSAAMNYALWQNIDIPTNKNYVNTGSTFEEHYDYLRNYITNRTAYLDFEWME